MGTRSEEEKKNESKNRSRRAHSLSMSPVCWEKEKWKKEEAEGKKKEAEAYVWTRVGASIADRLERWTKSAQQQQQERQQRSAVSILFSGQVFTTGACIESACRVASLLSLDHLFVWFHSIISFRSITSSIQQVVGVSSLPHPLPIRVSPKKSSLFHFNLAYILIVVYKNVTECLICSTSFYFKSLFFLSYITTLIFFLFNS